MYRGVDELHREKLIQLKTTEMANSDLNKYYHALDRLERMWTDYMCI